MTQVRARMRKEKIVLQIKMGIIVILVTIVQHKIIRCNVPSYVNGESQKESPQDNLFLYI